jgi:MEDS: MEthanogen/methylotroph, DcmR Sensory domain
VTQWTTVDLHKRMELVHSKQLEERRSSNPVRDLKSAPDWNLVGHRAHAVQFYENDTFLIELLSRFVGASLVTGDSAIVVATPRHREALAERLRALGFDLTVPLKQKRYLPFDAAETLARFMRGSRPDPVLFNGIVGPVIEDAREAARTGRGRIVAFGEMVALLWAEGKIEAALELEEFWNRLADVYSFSLCCAYPMSGFLGNPHAAPFLKICAQHTHVFPAERRQSNASY